MDEFGLTVILYLGASPPYFLEYILSKLETLTGLLAKG